MKFKPIVSFLVALALMSSCSSVVNLPTAATQTSAQSQPITVPFTLHDNRILIDVMVNGAGPFKFVFDTGGARSNSMNTELAKHLGLKVVKSEDAHGAGNNAVESGLAKVASYSVGDLVALDQDMYILDYTPIKNAFAFPRLDGILGFDVLKKSVTCIDNEKQTLTFRDDDTNCFRGGDRYVLPFRVDGGSPVINGKVNGIATELFLDTGDRSAFSLFKKFSVSSGLGRKFKGKPEVASGYGIGGPIPARLTTLDEIQLGRQPGNEVVMKKVLSRLPSNTGGFFAKSPLGGSVGNEILRRFNIIFNYPKNEMTLIPNSHFNEPYKFVPPLTK